MLIWPGANVKLVNLMALPSVFGFANEVSSGEILVLLAHRLEGPGTSQAVARASSASASSVTDRRPESSSTSAPARSSGSTVSR